MSNTVWNNYFIVKYFSYTYCYYRRQLFKNVYQNIVSGHTAWVYLCKDPRSEKHKICQNLSISLITFWISNWSTSYYNIKRRIFSSTHIYIKQKYTTGLRKVIKGQNHKNCHFCLCLLTFGSSVKSKIGIQVPYL